MSSKESSENTAIEIRIIGERVSIVDERSKKNMEKISTIELKTVNYDNMQKIVYGVVALALTTIGTGVVMLLMKT